MKDGKFSVNAFTFLFTGSRFLLSGLVYIEFTYPLKELP